ncbi:MAG: hypothetical protein ACP5JP_08835 [bacterium]
MKQINFVKFMILIIMLGTATRVFATPSTTYWTPDVMDIQAYGIPHLGIDNYFTIDNRANGGSAFPTDLGLTMGVLPFDKIQMEVGVDAMEPSPYPYMFNAKIGTPEGLLFKGSPGWGVGVFDVGTEPTVTGYDIGYVLVGKTVPYLGRLTVSYYYGNHGTLVSSKGNPENQGWMVAFDRTLITLNSPWIYSIAIAGDYASGKNYIGGGGFGLYFNFTPNIDLLTGPVWFNDVKMNGDWKWTTQLDINF